MEDNKDKKTDGDHNNDKPKRQPQKPLRPLTEDEKKMLARNLGFVAGIFSKALLQFGGCEVDYKINGEDISNIEKLQGLDISERIKLAVKEERYDDAAKLKKILDKISIDKNKEHES